VQHFAPSGDYFSSFAASSIDRESVLSSTGKSSIRQPDLPAQMFVYYVIALALYKQLDVMEGCAREVSFKMGDAARNLSGQETV
jgi:hypothetical protein